MASVTVRSLGAGRLPALSARISPNGMSAACCQRRNISKDAPSFVLNAFHGRVNLKEVLPYPQVLSVEQAEMTKMLVEPTLKFFTEVNDAGKSDTLEKVPDEVMEGLKELGAFGMQVPVDYSGLGLTNTQYARLVEAVGGFDLGTAIALGAHQSIGFKGITLFGTPEQKAKYLPKVASGEWIAAFALTEPTSGSDAQSIRTSAVLSDDGKHYILNGSKIWISNGGIAEVFTVFAQTKVRGPKGEVNKVTAFIVQRSFGGVTSGPPEKKMGIKASNTAEVYFDNVKVPRENVLGVPGDGFKIAMAILNNGRFGMGAALSGCMKGLITKAVDHASTRKQFNSKLCSFGMIQEKLARMEMNCYAAESMAFLLSSNMDRGTKEFQVEAAISKIFSSEKAWEVADETLQILGGMGFMKEAGVERVVRDLRIFRIFEGTNEILRLLVALTGCQFVGKNLRPWDISSVTRFVGRKFQEDDSEKLVKSVDRSLRDPAQTLIDSVQRLGSVVADSIVEHKKGIIDQQFTLQRIANAAIDIYAMMACIARCEHSISCASPSAKHEMLLTTSFVDEAFKRVTSELDAIKTGGESGQFSRFQQLSEHIVEHGGYIPVHPLGF